MEERKILTTREQILSIAQKAEFLGYDSLSVNDHIVFRTSWLDALSALSAVAAVTNKIKLGTFYIEYSCKKSCYLCQSFISYRYSIFWTDYLQQELDLVHIKEIMTFVEFLLRRDGVDLTKH